MIFSALTWRNLMASGSTDSNSSGLFSAPVSGSMSLDFQFPLVPYCKFVSLWFSHALSVVIAIYSLFDARCTYKLDVIPLGDDVKCRIQCQCTWGYKHDFRIQQSLDLTTWLSHQKPIGKELELNSYGPNSSEKDRVETHCDNCDKPGHNDSKFCKKYHHLRHAKFEGKASAFSGKAVDATNNPPEAYSESMICFMAHPYNFLNGKYADDISPRGGNIWKTLHQVDVLEILSKLSSATEWYHIIQARNISQQCNYYIT